MFTGTIANRLPAMWASAAPVLAGIDDTSNTRKLQIIAGGLAALGIFLLLFTVWFWRSSRADHAALGPLEVMGARRWRKAPMNEQINRLSEVRPQGALALAGTARPAVDLDQLVAGHRFSTPDRQGGGFSDLVEGEPQSLVGSVEDPWDGDLDILDDELDSTGTAAVTADHEAAADFDPDHSPRPTPEALARIDAAASASSTATVGSAPPATTDGGILDPAPGEPAVDDRHVDDGHMVAAATASDAQPSPEADAEAEAEAGDTSAGAAGGTAAQLPAEEAAPNAPERGAELAAPPPSEPEPPVAAAPPAPFVEDAPEPPVAPAPSEPSVGDRRQPSVAGGPDEISGNSAPTASGAQPFDDAHPHDAGDALAEALAVSESDDDAEFDPSKELAFERPKPVPVGRAGAATGSFKPPLWRRFRR